MHQGKKDTSGAAGEAIPYARHVCTCIRANLKSQKYSVYSYHLV